eukprot:10613801-Ditylum_brightwellii.AAC.1
MNEQELLERITMLEAKLAGKNDENDQLQKKIEQQAEMHNQQDKQITALEKDNALQNGDKDISNICVITISEGDQLEQG